MIASRLACDLGIEHKVTTIRRKDFIDLLSQQIDIQDCPSGGLMNLGQYENFKTAQTLGLKVILDGAGLDEAFGGYRSYHEKYLEHLKSISSPNLSKQIELYTNFWGISPKIQNNTPSIAQIDGSSDSIARAQVNDSFDEFRSEKIFSSKLLRGLRMKDRASMANSLELRVPFVDSKVINFGLSSQVEYLFKDGCSKSPLRCVGEKFGYSDIFRRPKVSINAPQAKWLYHYADQIYEISSSQFCSFDEDIVNDFNKEMQKLRNNCLENSFGIWRVLNSAILLSNSKNAA